MSTPALCDTFLVHFTSCPLGMAASFPHVSAKSLAFSARCTLHTALPPPFGAAVADFGVAPLLLLRGLSLLGSAAAAVLLRAAASHIHLVLDRSSVGRCSLVASPPRRLFLPHAACLDTLAPRHRPPLLLPLAFGTRLLPHGRLVDLRLRGCASFCAAVAAHLEILAVGAAVILGPAQQLALPSDSPNQRSELCLHPSSDVVEFIDVNALVILQFLQSSK